MKFLEDLWFIVIFQAARNFHPDWKKSDVRRLLGVKVGKAEPLPVKEDQPTLKTIPNSFDARDEWSTCDSIKSIKDQSDCGSCWVRLG